MSPVQNVPISATGNPFVDTGLAVIAALAGLDDLEELTVQQMRRIHRDGTHLSLVNSKLKNFTMVFTKNSLLTNASIRDEAKRTKMYLSVVNGLINKIGHEELSFRCECCGAPRTLDFDQLCRYCLAEVESGRETRFVGRDWFPLAGSMGSDAQALPAASRPACLCATCLFAVHYLPQGLLLLDGKLTVFQSTSIAFWYGLVRDIVNDVQSRLGAGIYDNLGAKEGSREVLRRILGLFERLQHAKRFSDFPPGAALEAWRFTNSNPPNCDVLEIPNPVLRFLWEAVSWGLRQEIENLVSHEGKSGKPFLRCVLERSDYRGLYPKGKYSGVSPKLFALYQTYVCGHTPKSLTFAHSLAAERTRELQKKELERLKREEAFSESSARNQFRGMIARLVSETRFTYEDYVGLFPLIEDAPGIRVSFEGWNLVRYYLHHVDGFEALQDQSPQPAVSSKTDAVRYYAAEIMRDLIQERGKSGFQHHVMDRMAREIGAAWLRRQFVRLAESKRGFSYEGWKQLCPREGRPFVGELLFQMRLLWSQWMRELDTPHVGAPELANGGGLPRMIAEMLKHVFADYTGQRGLSRFREDVLTRLRRGDIGIGWFRKQVTNERTTVSEIQPLGEEEWDDFLRDAEGGSCAPERLFQMHLMFANFYRAANDPKKEITT